MGKKRNAQNKQQLQNNNQVQRGQQIDNNNKVCNCVLQYTDYNTGILVVRLQRELYASLLNENEGLRKEITRLTNNEKIILDIINKK